MNARSLTEDEAKRIHAEPVNWEPLIKEYTWWQSKTGERQFVIVRVGYDFPDPVCAGKVIPVRVEFLELHKTEPIRVTWTQFIELAIKGEMKRVTG
jgi:hypothetical protein